MVVGDMGWLDLYLGCSTILPTYPAILPRQNLADTGMTKIFIDNPTQPNPYP